MRLLLFLIYFLIQLNSFAQFGFGKPEEIQMLRERTTLIALEEENDKLVKKYSKDPNKLAAYRNSIKWYNEAIQTTVTSMWKFNDKYEFKSKSEIVDILDSKEVKNYSVLFLLFYEYASNSRDISSLGIDLAENVSKGPILVSKGSPIYKQDLPRLFPRKGDIAMGLQLMQGYMTSRLIGKTPKNAKDEMLEYAVVLKTKILLIDKEDLNKGENMDKLKNSYPYPIEIVDYNIIENAILERNPKYCYAQILPTFATSSIGIALDAERGMSVGISPIINKSDKIGSKELIGFLQFVK
jgi:hypothetical protein